MITQHAKKRIKGRVGVKNVRYNFELARRKGAYHNKFEGDFGKFLSYLAMRNKCKILVYNNHIYIIKGKHLVTVLNVPIRYKNIKPIKKSHDKNIISV